MDLRDTRKFSESAVWDIHLSHVRDVWVGRDGRVYGRTLTNSGLKRSSEVGNEGSGSPGVVSRPRVPST